MEAQETLRGNRVRSRGSKVVEEVAEAAVAVTGTSVQSNASATDEYMALRRAALGEGVPGGGTGGEGRESLLVDGELEDRRRFLMDAGHPEDPLHSPPSAEAYVGAGVAREQIDSEEGDEEAGGVAPGDWDEV